MSRRSLRLDDGVLDRSLPHSSTSFSVGGTSWRSARSLKSRRSQQLSVSCSESLLLNTPRKLNSSLHSEASDASLLSSLLDDSSVHENTLVDTLWGLDHNIDPKESTIIAEQSTVLADRTLIGSDSRCLKHPPQTLSRVYCKDCELHTDRKESTHCRSSSSSSSSSSYRTGPSELGEPQTSTIYCRDRRPRTRTDVLQLWLDSCVLCVRRAAACCVSVLTHTWQVCQGLPCIQTDGRHGARSSHCGVMSLKESTTNQKELHPNGSLCDDCREKRRPETDSVASPSASWSSVASCLLEATWSAAVFTAGDVCRRFHRQWHHMTACFLLTRFPLRLLLLLLPLLLLLLSLCWFGPAALHSVLPAVSLSDWRTLVSDVPGPSVVDDLTSPLSQSAEGAVEEPREAQPYEEASPAAEAATGEKEAAVVDESGRLVRMEQSLTALWERVEAGGRRAERRHREVLQLYTDLQQQQQSSGGDESWLNILLEQQLQQLRTQLDEGKHQRQQESLQQQSQTSRLDQLELQLQTLAAETQEVLGRREAAAAVVSSSAPTLPAAVSVGVDRQSHDALLAEVARLKAALEDVRRDVEGLSVCRDGCRRLDGIQQTISEQVSTRVREEVRSLAYGSQLAVGGGASGDLPESLLQWLSQQYVSGAELQVALASLERHILQNISLQLERRRGEEAVREAVVHTAKGAVTEEDVHAIVKDALRLFSQDRTGLADYALESGGGSVLSTRCSETFETKAALLSLFGVPLWYFSQSPRAVIQPDVHPGNCWAFRGSTGFLVIRLSMRILPTAFTLEHIPKALAPSGTLRSAPRRFDVYGLEDEGQDGGTLLGSYTYEEDGEALQTYSVTEESERSFQIIEVQVLSNWGHPEFTCMYRFRVHGTPADV